MGQKLLIDELRFTPTLRLLSDGQMDALHQAALEILGTTGVGIKHPQAREILAGAGCRVDGDRVLMPAAVVEKAMASAPSAVTFGNRHGGPNMVVTGADTFFGSTIDCVNYLDPATGDLVDCDAPMAAGMARLTDALDNYDWTMTLGIARDWPESVADLGVARMALENCAKPVIVSANDADHLDQMYQMALLCQGGEAAFRSAPILGTLNCTISPLMFDDKLAEKDIFAARKGIPIVHYSGMQLGSSFPATMAAGIAMGCAESLSGLVLQQAVNPGSPGIFGSFITIMDMKCTIFSYGAIELAMMVGGMAQMAQRYGLPFFGTAGCTDAKEVDAQAAVEGSLQDFIMAGVGGGMVHDTHCWLDHGNTLSPAHLVLGQEILAMVKQVTKGIPVSDETLALDLIHKVGPGGNFLMEGHTMKHFREMLYLDIMKRTKARQPGKEMGERLAERLRDKTLALLAAPPVHPLAPEVVAQLDAMQARWFAGK